MTINHLSHLATAVLAPLHAEIIGVQAFSFPPGPIADRTGGPFWDWKNTVTAGHTGTASAWANASAAPATISGGLLTDSSAAQRNYKGADETAGL